VLVALPPGKEPSLLTAQEVGWIMKPAWTFWRR